jgi:sigma-B regulation protein RsbU (phosphoserine phosphatase)
LAWRIQAGLLPRQNVAFAGWETHYRYVPLGRVSGDYCDLVEKDGAERALFFLLGDVSGKGVAASFLMAHLNALFRSLIDGVHPLEQIVERANRIFSESTISSHYATLVAGRASETGEIQILNAGHCPPVVVRSGKVASIEATGFPVGLFQGNPYEIQTLRLQPGDTLFLYSDGLTEAGNGSSDGYGEERLHRLVESNRSLSPARLAAAVMKDLDDFLGGAPRSDDLTLMAIRRSDRP